MVQDALINLGRLTMTEQAQDKPPIIDRAFADKFLLAADRPMEHGVYFLLHDWWEGAPQSALDAYAANLRAMPGADEFFAEASLPEPLKIADLERCAPGTLGAAYKDYIVDNNLYEDFARNYRVFHQTMVDNGTFDRLPEEMRHMLVRGTQVHDFLHVITGWDSSPIGELGMAGFHFAQMKFAYHAMRFAITAAHVAFVAPEHIEMTMDAMMEGWLQGRKTPNLHFAKWEEQLDRPLEEIRAEYGLSSIAMAA